MRAFHNDPALKEKYLARVRAHAAADEIVHGQYWENGKGCAVGCTIHGSDHARYETELGIPEWLARLEDSLFENLSNGGAKAFPEQFLAAIPVGVDLELVRWQFCSFLMRENIERVSALNIDREIKAKVVSAVRGVLAVHASATRSGKLDAAAWSAAWSAWSAAESAAWSAWSAAESAAYLRYRDELLRLLRESGGAA